jgi:hypothetical protein
VKFTKLLKGDASYKSLGTYAVASCVQTISGFHPASCTMGTGVPFPGGKAQPRRDAEHSPPYSAEVKND